jgi:hypothetical protein
MYSTGNGHGSSGIITSQSVSQDQQQQFSQIQPVYGMQQIQFQPNQNYHHTETHQPLNDIQSYVLQQNSSQYSIPPTIHNICQHNFPPLNHTTQRIDSDSNNSITHNDNHDWQVVKTGKEPALTTSTPHQTQLQHTINTRYY